MAAKMVANIKAGDADEPLETKVLRKCVSFGRTRECWYTFIDKNGGTIEAAANLSDIAYFDSLIKVNTCCRIHKYIFENARRHMMMIWGDCILLFGLGGNVKFASMGVCMESSSRVSSKQGKKRQQKIDSRSTVNPHRHWSPS